METNTDSQEEASKKPGPRLLSHPEEVAEISAIIRSVITENSGGAKFIKFIVELLRVSLANSWDSQFYDQENLDERLLTFIKEHHPDLGILEYYADLGGGHLRSKTFIYNK